MWRAGAIWPDELRAHEGWMLHTCGCVSRQSTQSPVRQGAVRFFFFFSLDVFAMVCWWLWFVCVARGTRSGAGGWWPVAEAAKLQSM